MAGGPLLPCIYLQPIVHLITDRSIIFYDALGCGQSQLDKSKVPTNKTVSSMSDKTTTTKQDDIIPDMVQDLAFFIQRLALPHFHLLGHSFGGIIAYEYLKTKSLRHIPSSSPKNGKSSCLSLTLVSTPVSIAQAINHSHELQDQLRQEYKAEGKHDFDVDGDGPLLAEYAKRHECRLEPIPLPLQQALFGVFSSASKGLAAVQHYNAQESSNKESLDGNQPIDGQEHDDTPDYLTTDAHPFPPSLVLRGEHDFVSLECQEEWRSLLGKDVQFVEIPDSAHYTMLENEDEFANAVRTVLRDPPA